MGQALQSTRSRFHKKKKETGKEKTEQLLVFFGFLRPLSPLLGLIPRYFGGRWGSLSRNTGEI